MEYAREIELSSDGNTFVLGSFGYSPAGRTRVFQEEQSSGLSVVEKLEFNMYPNPASELVNLRWSSDKGQSIYQLIDMQGRVLRNGSISSGLQVSLVGLLPGLYLFRLASKDGRWAEQVLSIQR